MVNRSPGCSNSGAHQNKDSYLKALADRLVTGAGSPQDWGATGTVPSDLGFAAASGNVYVLDPDKISRLNSHNAASLTYLDLVNSSKLTDIALGISVFQLMDVDVVQVSNQTVGDQTEFSFQFSTEIDSKPIDAELHCYVISQDYFYSFNASTSSSGTGDLSVQIPTDKVTDALMVAFARTPLDERLTSFTVYNFLSSTTETTPSNTQLSLSPLDQELSFNSSEGTVTEVYCLSYNYNQSVTSIGASNCTIPVMVDASPRVLFACGFYFGNYFEVWTAYPQVPLTAGSAFTSSERNIFTYTVEIDGVLYRLQFSLGAINH